MAWSPKTTLWCLWCSRKFFFLNQFCFPICVFNYSKRILLNDKNTDKEKSHSGFKLKRSECAQHQHQFKWQCDSCKLGMSENLKKLIIMMIMMMMMEKDCSRRIWEQRPWLLPSTHSLTVWEQELAPPFRLYFLHVFLFFPTSHCNCWHRQLFWKASKFCLFQMVDCRKTEIGRTRLKRSFDVAFLTGIDVDVDANLDIKNGRAGTDMLSSISEEGIVLLPTKYFFPLNMNNWTIKGTKGRQSAAEYSSRIPRIPLTLW